MAVDSHAQSAVVVGVADSPAGRWALAWAVGFARRLRMPLKAVVAYPPQVHGPYAAALTNGLREAAEALARRVFDEVCGGIPGEVPVEVITAAGVAGRVLTELADSADLLVIGSAGRWRGRTRAFCARHARCPLVVVPRPDVAGLLGAAIPTAKQKSDGS